MPSIPQALRIEVSQPLFGNQQSSASTLHKKSVTTSSQNGNETHPSMPELEEVKSIFCNADAVCFDVDSTVCTDEAIDELAKFCGKEKEVSQITRSAMSGKLDFRSALRARLGIIKPTLQQVQSYTQSEPPKLTPRIRELVKRLHEKDIPVYLVSGGFRIIIAHVAHALEIPMDNVFANKLKFFYNGEYAGFDEDVPVSRAGGKAEIVKILKETFNYKRVVMIGDGATDLQTCPPADAFIGFGGNVIREEVKKGAKWYVMDFQELIDELNSVPVNRPSI